MGSHNQSKIDRYLHGRMSEDEKKSFEAEMEADDELKKQYLSTKAGEDARLKDKMGHRDEEMEKEKEKPVSSSSKRKWMYAAVGMAAAVLAAFFILHVESTTYSPPTVGDGGGSPFNKEVDSLVGNKEYAKALEEIEGKVTDCDNYINFYKNCIENTVPEEEEEEKLSPEEAEQKKKETEAELMELKLMKVQVLLKMEEKDKAATILKELAHEASPVQEKAKELLQEIN